MTVLLNSLFEVKSLEVGLSYLNDRSSYHENVSERAFSWRQTVISDGNSLLRISSFSEIFADWGVC